MRIATAATQLFLIVSPTLVSELAVGDDAAPPINIAATKRLTWDDSLLDKADGIRFEMHQPRRTGERNLVGDKPWESWQIGGMSSLLHENGKFRLWYGVSHGIRHGEEYAVAYAESDDGIRWTKPELGLVEYAGSKKNNLVVAYSSVIGQVFVDPHAKAGEKYKMLAAIYPTKDSDPKRYLTLLSSPDGLAWSPPRNNVVREGDFALDTQSQAFWDRDRKSYVLYTRMGPWRQVGRSESADPFAFPAPQNVMRPEEPVKADYYQAGVTKYEEAANAYFGLVPIFFHPGDERGNPTDGNPPLTFTYVKTRSRRSRPTRSTFTCSPATTQFTGSGGVTMCRFLVWGWTASSIADRCIQASAMPWSVRRSGCTIRRTTAPTSNRSMGKTRFPSTWARSRVQHCVWMVLFRPRRGTRVRNS